MKTIKIPGALQELFGKEITVLELMVSIVAFITISALLLTITFEEWQNIALWRQILLFIITIDISGGIVANFSYSTNQYYQSRPKARLKFILIHIQPVVLTFLLNSAYILGIVVTIYTMITALFTNALINHPVQRIMGATLMFLGITTFLLIPNHVPAILMALFAMHMFKVIYAFSVDHYRERKVLKNEI